MASQLSSGTNFVDGSTYGAADFNAAVDNGTILPGLITEQASIGTNPVGADQFVGVQASTGHLFNTTLTQLIAGFPTDDANTVPSLRTLGATAGKAAAGDDSRFPAALSGIRKANLTSPDTVATPGEIAFNEVILNGAGGSQSIDWSLGNVFYVSLSNTTTYTHLNTAVGRQITVVVKLNAHVANFPTPTLGSFQILGAGTTVAQATFTQVLGGITCSIILL